MNRESYRFWMRWAGRLLGAGVVTLAICCWPGLFTVASARGSLISDADGPLQELVLHWTPEAQTIAVPAWRDLFQALPASVTVHVACPDAASFEFLRQSLGSVPPTLHAILLGHPLTCWSRDRWLALQGPSHQVTLFLPETEDGASTWTGRAGDALVGCELVKQLPDLTGTKLGWQFDAGDVVADAETAFVTERMLKRNLGIMGTTIEEVRQRLGEILHRRVVFLIGGPDHHACMVMMVAGKHRVVVGDPSLAARILGPRQHQPDLTPCGDDFSPETQGRFDAVAKACQEAGYTVTRIPLVPGKDGRAFLAWVNGLIDERDGRKTFFMPSFRPAPADLETAATKVWEDLGYTVVKTDCTTAFPLGGSLRCLVNVLRRSSTPG